MKKRLFALTVVLAALVALWPVSLVSGTELPELTICIDLEKTGPETALPGETITYHFWVHNCGEVPFLSHARVIDLVIDPINKLWEEDLYPDDIAEFDRSYTLPTDRCGAFVNDARAKGVPVLDDGTVLPDVTDYDSWIVEILCGPGTGTPGYWMNHPDAWPVGEITIGGVVYSKDEAIMYMKMEVKQDKTLTMFPALVAAKLNVLIGNDDSCIADIIADADGWLTSFPPGSGVKANSEAWQYSHGEQLYWALDAYNNGDAPCVTSRDAFD